MLLYTSVQRQNALLEVGKAIPQLTKEVKALQEENRRLKYSVESFENPIHLIELSRSPEYGHLKYPYVEDIVIIPFQESP